MKRLFLLAAFLLASLVFVAGCQQDMKNAWKSTKKYYAEYVNTPAELEFEEADVEPVEERLAHLFTPVGMQLESLRRDLDSQDSFPADNWVSGILAKYPWLSGIAVVDPDGRELLRQPEMYMKPLDFSSLLERREETGERDLRAYVEDNPMGHEVYVATPFFVDADYKGLVIAHFDMRNLLKVCPNPGHLVVFDGSSIIWAGKFLVETTPLADRDWELLMKKESTGYVENETGEFLWVSKYLGNVSLGFATTSDSFPENPAVVTLDGPERLGSVPEPVVAE